MFEKLESVVLRFEELESLMNSGGLLGPDLAKAIRERGQLVELVDAYLGYRKLISERVAAKEMIADKDPELSQMAKEEFAQIEVAIADAEKALQVLTLPKDPDDDKNVILEIRAGTGGDEAGLFVGDLLRMYQKYADRRGWRVEFLGGNESSAGGYKEVAVLLSGGHVYSRLKFEMGVHRVQRVPQTEAQGRIHTSACTVAVLPEAEEVDIEINPKDLEITTCRSSGAGGQHVNTTDSAIRIVHLPTGIAVECQAERSQHKNKEKALKLLNARLLEKAQKEQADRISAERKDQVGTGDRSERIRTYNFPQGRLTDHRINMTLYRLDSIMGGDLDEVLDGLAADHQARLVEKELGSQG